MRLILRLLLLLLAVFASLIAIANRHPVVLSLDPLPWELELPLYAVLFAALVAGLVIGLLAEWRLAGRWRREARHRRRESRVLAQENARLQAGASGGPPALTPGNP